jgi:hypothetical protein
LHRRYYKSDIALHGFDDGQSLPKKQDNWAQIEKFCQKKGLALDVSVLTVKVKLKGKEVEAGRRTRTRRC